jgi:DNA mismatch repair protein MutL
MPIRKLPAHLVNQIAAGEVIERPASVVKELIENSLDAGARRIEVRVEEGGRQRIRVADDGGGIGADQVLLALEPHATSKIEQVEDLAAIRTLGFRGEALASIASVSRLSLTTRTADATEGYRVEAVGDQLSEVEPVACAAGTVVDVQDLFFNTPARRKFMRGASTEYGHINDLVGRVSMAHAHVGFSLWHNDKLRWDHPPGQTPNQRCRDRLGKEVAEGLIEFESDERGVALWGLAAMPELAKPTAKHQYVFINGRPIRDRSVSHAMREAYRGLIEPSRQPMVVLFITVDPATVDVNVHPAKSEVRFSDARAVHSQVLSVLRQALQSADLTPAVPVVRPFVSTSTHQSTRAISSAPSPAGAFWLQASDAPRQTVASQVAARAVDAVDGPLLTEPIRATTQPILQIHNTYIVTQDEQGIVIIDQHALHERMMFETLLDRLGKTEQLESQRLLTPVVMNGGPARQATLEQITPLLHRLGIDATPMGPESIAVHAFPTLLFERKVDVGEFMDDLLGRAEAENFEPSNEAALHEVLDMMSCKAAIKAGDRLSDQELADLLARRDQIERASNCPHGRPTTVRLTLHDLEKHFKRS